MGGNQGEVRSLGRAARRWGRPSVFALALLAASAALASSADAPRGGFGYPAAAGLLAAGLAAGLLLGEWRQRAARPSAGEQALRDLHYRSLFSDNPTPVFSLDSNGRLQSANPAAVRLLGLSAGELHNFPIEQFIVPEDRRRAMACLQLAGRGRPQDYEVGIVNAQGELLALQVVNVPIRVGDYVAGVYCIARDITRRKRKESQLAWLASYDILTGLPNRYLLEDRLGAAIAGARRSGATVALMFLDLDRFKQVNDRFGHAQGDVLLKHVAARLSSVLRESDTLARLGGDEFTVLVQDVESPALLEAISERIMQAFASPFTLDEREVSLGVSIGVAFYPRDGESAEDLLRIADQAMYQHKKMGQSDVSVACPQVLDPHQ